MAGRKVKTDEAREHERRAWDLRQRGWTQERIAEELSVTQQAVSKILARISDRVLKQLAGQVERQKAEQAAQLEDVVDEAMQAWERSKQNAQSVVKKTVPGEDADGRPTTVETVTIEIQGQTGNVAYLAEARAALQDLRKVWGLDAPVKLEHGGKLEIVSVVFGSQDEPEGNEAVQDLERRA